jgi:acyl-CoA synthetase (AMP-forming)/AMP-acid ligase II
MASITIGHASDVGKILDGIQVKVVDREIFVKTPFLMIEYADTNSTKESFDKEWFKTGDYADIQNDSIIFNDRKKDIIIRGGENISPKEIEEVILLANGVLEVAVVGVEHEIYGEDIVAFVVAKEEKQELLDNIKAICNNHLSANKIPANFIFIKALPRVDSGKIDKKTLRRMV